MPWDSSSGNTNRILHSSCINLPHKNLQGCRAMLQGTCGDLPEHLEIYILRGRCIFFWIRTCLKNHGKYHGTYWWIPCSLLNSHKLGCTPLEGEGGGGMSCWIYINTLTAHKPVAFSGAAPWSNLGQHHQLWKAHESEEIAALSHCVDGKPPSLPSPGSPLPCWDHPLHQLWHFVDAIAASN